MTEARSIQFRFSGDAGPSWRGIFGRRTAHGTSNRLFLLISLVFILNLTSRFHVSAAAASSMFGGLPVSPGATVQASVPLSPMEKSYAAQGGNPVPPYAVAVMATPANFDPGKSWPVLVVCSTTDSKRQNRDDLVDFYRRIGLPEGWVLLAGDGPQHAKNDNVAWREAMTMAAVDALHRSFPGAKNWPIACAGFSGGGKAVGYVAPFLARNGCHIIGIYVTGANEDHLSDGYATLRPGAEFLNTPVYVSAGHEDRIATLEQQYAVVGSIKRTGFRRIRIGTFRGGHEANGPQTSIALHWFRELAK